MPHNRIHQYFRPGATTNHAKSDRRIASNSASPGFVLIPANSLPVAGTEKGNSLTSALSRIYEQALENARQQAAQVPANRVVGFWKKGRPS